MQLLTYGNVDSVLIHELPELAAPYARCVSEDEHPGQYIVFEDLFAHFIEILLAMPSSPTRDHSLQRAFAFVDRMLLSTDGNVTDLAFIAMYEGRPSWWLARARSFLRPVSEAQLDTFRPDWRDAASMQAQPDPEREIIDLYGTRDVIAEMLKDEGIGIAAVPGISAPRVWTRYPSLEQARLDARGTIFLSCFGTSVPYVVGPAAAVACDEPTLLSLARDLASTNSSEPNQREKARSACYPIALGERVWNMQTVDSRHARYHGVLWIRADFVLRGLEGPIRRVLDGEQRRLQSGFHAPGE